ncbi:MAG: DUF1801 domain-containing protein [Chloroflexi bacterium]|nr:DUF1801 domain-containing protein [Chloroflexota bacterium]
MTTGNKKPLNTDDYISGFTPDIQEILEKIRLTIRTAAPQAQEVISYQMPAFKQGGILVYFAAWKKHIGFYPPLADDSPLKKEVAPYEGPKGNLIFPLNQPIPYDLIEKIMRHKVEQLKGN